MVRIDTGDGFRPVEVVAWDGARNTATITDLGLDDRVLIVDDDQLVDGPVPRAGVQEPAVLWHKVAARASGTTA